MQTFNEIGPKSTTVAIKILKEFLCNPQILVHDAGESPIELQTGASKIGLGAVFMLNKVVNLHPVRYLSQSLTPAEKTMTLMSLNVWSKSGL